MEALILKAHGGVDNFDIVHTEMPSVRSSEVLVRIAAASLNQIDNKIRGGLPIGPDLPGILGCDFAGTVEAIGSEVIGFKPGDEVFGMAGGVKGRGGALAQYIAADHRLIARKPTNLSMREAAALPLVTLTAWEAIERSGMSASEKVLVHGGAGGVGHIAIQIAKVRQAEVAATVGSEDDGDIARSFGAGGVILYKQEKPADYVKRLTGGEGFAVIIDTVGGANLTNSFEAASLNGRIMTTASRATLDLTPVHNKGLSFGVVFILIPMLYGIGMDRQGKILREIAEMVERGKLRALIDKRQFALADAPEAYRLLEGGEAHGKIVIDIG
ncbi:zinc-binding dehydrogenase [Rhizobium laguerreae]|uniref:zinc-binding dehydrogenase n=1 Tax=Rhizobium laguerreae TaxID=1076926 RepID=UPI001C9086F9|nr:zinc-binding dehydrogenase [Rhizobium laguerreae]MBY3165700.1 zinc-binding dehydrogenase [Rhizobium laguerreae]